MILGRLGRDYCKKIGCQNFALVASAPLIVQKVAVQFPIYLRKTEVSLHTGFKNLKTLKLLNNNKCKKRCS